MDTQTAWCRICERLAPITSVIDTDQNSYAEIDSWSAKVGLQCGHGAHIVTTHTRLLRMRDQSASGVAA